jgi:hypothetical protein
VLKDPGILLDLHRAGAGIVPNANPPIEIDADLGALARVLEAPRA